MRVINADALKESLKKLKAEGNNRKYVQGLQDAIDGYFPQIIDDEPTIDAEPVRHGRWIVEKGSGEYAVCSECGGKSGTQWDGVEPIPLMTPFCPNCGARMDGDDND